VPPYYDNPAGRLHELLRQLGEQDKNAAIVAGWAQVLQVAESDVVLRIGAVFELVREIQEAVDELDDDILRAPVSRLRDQWARPIFPLDIAFLDTLSNVLPPAEALESLGLVAAQLSLRVPEGKVPTVDELTALKTQLRDLVGAVREADDLTEDVKHVIVARLLDVETAIEHIHVGGPEAVRRATEAVVGTMVRTAQPGGKNHQTLKRVLATLGVLWVAFSAGPTVNNALEAWPDAVRQITSGAVFTPSDDNDGGNGSTVSRASDSDDERGSR
jgi:hypothetical protein